MHISDLVWVLPGEGHEQDGEFITRTKHGNVKQHIDVLEEFFKEFHLEMPSRFTIDGFAEELSKRNMLLLINAGRIDGKYASVIYLPQNLSKNQITTILDMRSTFENEFHHHVAFFGVNVYSINMNISYKIYSDLREIYQRDGIFIQDGIELFYKEKEKRKENLPKGKTA